MAKFLKKTIVEFFRDNKKRGAPLNRVMLWGFFFRDRQRKKLKSVIPELTAKGFRYVDIWNRSKESPDLWLHVEVAKEYSPSTLLDTCNDLDGLAIRAGIGDFDGFDVGNVDGSILYE